MERDKQITKLVNVLRRTAGSLHGNPSSEIVEQALGQYNRVLASLAKIDEEVGDVFVPLKEGASADVISAGCRQLAAYYRDEVEGIETPFDSDSFREFWRKSAQDLEDVGEFIRESISRMQERKTASETQPHSNGET